MRDPTTETTVEMINPEQALRCLALCWTSKVPTLFLGGPGTAKTTTHRDFVARLNENKKKGAADYKLWVLALQRMEPGDFGVPVPDLDAKTTTFLTPSFLPFDDDKARGVICLDELDSARDEMQPPAMNVMLDREFHGHTLGDEVFVSACGNGVSDIYTTELREALRTRCASFFISAHADGYQESWQQFAEKAGLSPVTRAFRKYRSESVKKHEEFDEIAVCNDRTLEMADRVYTAHKRVQFETGDIILPALCGTIGKAAAMEYMAIERLVAEAPAPEDVISDPHGVAIPDEPSITYALSLAVVDTAKTLEDAEHASEYFMRLPDELTASAVKRLSKKHPKVMTYEPMREWANDNRAILV